MTVALVIFVELLVGRERLSKEPAIADLTARGIRCALAASLIKQLQPSQPIPDKREAKERQPTADQRRHPDQTCRQGKSQIPRRLDP